MKFNRKWLEEQLDYAAPDAQSLADTLTMAGLEVDAISPVAPAFAGVVVGEIVSLEQHPDADKLRVCQVAGHPDGNLKQVVCGAANARQGLKVPFATLGAELPGNRIKQARLRGVDSFGMLCAEQELGLAEASSGLWELPADAPVGTDIREYLQLDDDIIEVDLTPNRADCLSITGLAREMAALIKCRHNSIRINSIDHKSDAICQVRIHTPSHCARYAGRVVKNIDNCRPTPLWMVERLRRAGLRSLGPVVDITNYVLLELGQPMHAFDLAKVDGEIHARLAQPGESLLLLDGQTIELTADTLVIADNSKPLALAGIMGGADSAVSATTRDIVLESAWFNPVAMAGKARLYGLHTDSSHRFERGVDFNKQLEAIERATELLTTIAGGEPGPIVHETDQAHLPVRAEVALSRARLDQYLGIALPDSDVYDIFNRLGFSPRQTAEGWVIQPPSWRFDIAIEQDLIEEVARVYGYNRLPTRTSQSALALAALPETSAPIDQIHQTLVSRGYREIISYSFISPELQALFAPNENAVHLRNPISADLAAMRTSLLPSLVSTLQYNLNRQQSRARLFEHGLRFRFVDGKLQQEPVFGALLYGSRHPESWAGDTDGNAVDFHDLKGDLEALLARSGRAADYTFRASQHPALHPGQTAEILDHGTVVGLIGALHPELQRKLDIPSPVFLFEIARDALLTASKPTFSPLSRFPEVRRDIALLVNRTLPVQSLCDTVRTAAGDCLTNLVVFDIYCGEHIDPLRKSVALGLTFQHPSRTLNEAEIVAWVDAVLAAASQQHDACLRN